MLIQQLCVVSVLGEFCLYILWYFLVNAVDIHSHTTTATSFNGKFVTCLSCRTITLFTRYVTGSVVLFGQCHQRLHPAHAVAADAA